MKRVVWAMVVLLGLGAGYLGAAHLSGGAFATFGLPLGGDAGELRRTAMSFWEDIQFKDFESAAAYHAPELQDSVDIPYLIQRLFFVKPEMLDILEYEVVMVDIDGSGDRARVRSRLKVKELARGKIDEKQVMLYFAREDATSPWFMRLEDSLRPDKAEDDKQH
jgi:hypothetical protein